MGEEATPATADFGNGLIDVTGLCLADLDRIGQSSLDFALRRIVDELDAGPVAGFNATI